VEKAEFDRMNHTVIDEFRKNGGKVGGIFSSSKIVLVHHVGAKSGIRRIAPLIYFREGDRIFVFGSKRGADQNPSWYHNLVADPKTTIELGVEKFQVVARVLVGDERDKYFAKQAAVQPLYAGYQLKTRRTIPVVEFVRIVE
jgi:deazaflavin-dependent oxidoreductase (nitroreductase family)